MGDYEISKVFSDNNLNKKHPLTVFALSGGVLFRINDLIVTELAKRHTKGIQLTMDYTAEVLSVRLGKETAQKIHFIDSLSKKMNARIVDNATYVTDTTSLSELSVVITKLIDSGKYNFFFSDSTYLLFTNYDEQEAVRFINYLTAKLKQHNIYAVHSFSMEHGDSLLRELNKYGAVVIPLTI